MRYDSRTLPVAAWCLLTDTTAVSWRQQPRYGEAPPAGPRPGEGPERVRIPCLPRSDRLFKIVEVNFRIRPSLERGPVPPAPHTSPSTPPHLCRRRHHIFRLLHSWPCAGPAHAVPEYHAAPGRAVPVRPGAYLTSLWPSRTSPARGPATFVCRSCRPPSSTRAPPWPPPAPPPAPPSTRSGRPRRSTAPPAPSHNIP